jgi:hypothetical protein
LPGVDVIAHGQPKWLGRQHIDIWIPALNVGIEYHGLQHFQPVGFSGVRKRTGGGRSEITGSGLSANGTAFALLKASTIKISTKQHLGHWCH